MAINMMCTNENCVYYYEDNCMRNLNEERLELDDNGKCITFKEGVNENYKEEIMKLTLECECGNSKIITINGKKMKVYCENNETIYLEDLEDSENKFHISHYSEDVGVYCKQCGNFIIYCQRSINNCGKSFTFYEKW